MYEILEVGKDATAAQIKAAFRRLAIYYHPDKVKHLGDQAQRHANEKMKSVSEAFSILRNPEKRKLYDHCLAKGLDFTVEYSRAQSETKEQKEKRESKSETLGYMLQAASRVVLENIKLLVENPSWKVDESDSYYDYILRGLGGGNRLLVHIRVAEKITLDEVEKVMEYAKSMKAETKSLLIRDHFTFVLVAGSFKDAVELREKVKKFNQNLTSLPRGAPKKAICLIRIKSPKPFVPYGDLIQPPFHDLDMKLV